MCFELDDDCNDCLCQMLMCFGCCYLCKKCCGCGDSTPPPTQHTVIVHQPAPGQFQQPMYDPNQQGQWQQQPVYYPQQQGGYPVQQQPGYPMQQPGYQPGYPPPTGWNSSAPMYPPPQQYPPKY